MRTTTARCLVVTGADPAFCSGDDVKLVMGGGERPPSMPAEPRLTPAADALLHTDVPVVAAVNGAAVGLGHGAGDHGRHPRRQRARQVR